MSIKLMTQVYEHECSHPQQAILLAMADHADDSGRNCRPSVDLVAWKTGYGWRQVVNIIGELKEIKVLKVVRKASRHRATEYEIDLSLLPEKTPFDEWRVHQGRGAKSASLENEPEKDSGVQSENLDVQFSDLDVQQPLHPNRHIEPSGEPSVEYSRPVSDIAPQSERPTSPSSRSKTEEYRQRFEEVCESHPLGAELRACVGAVATNNDSGTLTEKRKAEEFAEGLLSALERYSHDAMLYGLNQAIRKQPKGFAYVLACAENFQPDQHGWILDKIKRETGRITGPQREGGGQSGFSRRGNPYGTKHGRPSDEELARMRATDKAEDYF